MVKSGSLVFGTLDGSLARAQTAALLEQIGERIPRLECDILVREMPPADVEEQPEPFLACRRRDLAALVEMLERGECRAVVMQAYDLPAPAPEGIEIHCVPDRGTPFDALLNRQGQIMDEMDPGSRIGVLCLRAKSQLACHWPDLHFRILAGGVDHAMETHLRRDEIDGLILPAAVTECLGIQGIVSEIFTPEFVLPAPGQGAVAILGRAGDTELAEMLAPLHSKASAHELAAERAFRLHMVTDMDLPVGVLARARRGSLTITGATGCGTNRVSVHGRLDEAEAAGSGLAQQLLSRPESFADLLEADFPHGLPEDADVETAETPGAATLDDDDYLDELILEESGEGDPDSGLD